MYICIYVYMYICIYVDQLLVALIIRVDSAELCSSNAVGMVCSPVILPKGPNSGHSDDVGLARVSAEFLTKVSI